MEKIVVKIQKLGFIFLIVTYALLFIYAIGMATPCASLLSWTGEIGGVSSSRFYDQIEPTNNIFLILGIVGLLVAAAFKLLRNDSRRVFYSSNYVWFGVFYAITIFSAVYIFIGVSNYQNLYSEIPFEEVNTYFTEMKFRGSVDPDTPVFILGYLEAVLILLNLIPMTILLVNKIGVSKKWKKHLKEVENKEEVKNEE